MSAIEQRDIPLSDTPRSRRSFKLVPTFASLSEPLVYDGDFQVLATRIVGLHVRKNWGLATRIADGELEMELEHDMLNEFDPNAVGVHARLAGGRVLVGYIDSEHAPQIAAALDGAAQLAAHPCGRPWAGGDSKGGSLSIIVDFAER